jgi:phage gp36-like protein
LLKIGGKNLKKIIVRIFEHKNKIDKERPLSWYDPLYKKMLTFKGLFLNFEIKEEKYIETEDGKMSLEDAIEEVRKHNLKNSRRIPVWQAKRIIDENCDVIRKYRLFPRAISDKKESKKTKVLEWFDRYQNYNNTSFEIVEENKDNVIFSGEKKDADDFIDELERNGFRFEIG